jgi:hypothetical protein
MTKAIIFISAIAIAYLVVYCAIRNAIRDEVVFLMENYEITKIND